MAEAEPKKRSAQDILAAVAVAGIAFWAPASDTGITIRAIYAVGALTLLFLATVGLELLQEWKAAKTQPKSNVFELKVRKLEVPTAPPGGVYAASCRMGDLLSGFPIDSTTDVKTTESGFQLLTGSNKAKVKVLAGTAIGWEQGGVGWIKGRQAWMDAVSAAPRIGAVLSANWMGVAALEPEERAPPECDVGLVVRIDGLSAKPELNGKLGSVVKRGDAGSGRFGVRPEGGKESLSLHGRNLTPLSAFDATGVSIPCIRAFRAQMASELASSTVSEAITSAPLGWNPALLPSSLSCRRRATAATHSSTPWQAS